MTSAQNPTLGFIIAHRLAWLSLYYHCYSYTGLIERKPLGIRIYHIYSHSLMSKRDNKRLVLFMSFRTRDAHQCLLKHHPHWFQASTHRIKNTKITVTFFLSLSLSDFTHKHLNQANITHTHTLHINTRVTTQEHTHSKQNEQRIASQSAFHIVNGRTAPRAKSCRFRRCRQLARHGLIGLGRH